MNNNEQNNTNNQQPTNVEPNIISSENINASNTTEPQIISNQNNNMVQEPVLTPKEEPVQAPSPTVVQEPQPVINQQPQSVEPVVPEPQPVTPPPVEPQNQNVAQDTTVNENLKKVEIDYKPPSKFKTFALIVFFIALIAFVIFLPEITEMVSKFKDKNAGLDEKITTGKLKCNLDTNTTNLDKSYNLVFSFTDNKLEKLDYKITTKGDATEDEKTLDDLAKKCEDLKTYTKDINGVTISCDYSEGKLVEKQSFVYGTFKEEELDAAYTEAGGTNPQYSKGQDMDSIEKQLNASEYTCQRERAN